MISDVYEIAFNSLQIKYMLTESEYTHVLESAEEGKPLPIVLKQLVLQGNDLVFVVEVAPAKPFSETNKT